MTTRLFAGLALLALLGSAAAQVPPVPGGKELKAVQEIRGKFEDNKDLPKMKAAPAGGVVADAEAFAKLWAEWKGQAERPKIDFQKQFVMAGTTQCAANRIFGNFTLTEAGDLKALFGSTLIGGPGFAWVIYVLDRDGVKTVNGKPLP